MQVGRSFTREGIAHPEQEGSKMRRDGSKPHRVHQSGGKPLARFKQG